MFNVSNIKGALSKINILKLDKALKNNVWRFLGVLILLDAAIILITPDAAVQATIAESTGLRGFPYVYGTIVLVCGLVSLFHPDKVARQSSALFFYVIHTFLLLTFSTAPHSITLLISFVNQDPLTEPVRGLAPFLKYLALCFMVLIYQDPHREVD